MSLVARLEEVRDKVKTRIEAIRGGSSILGGGSILSNPVGALPKLQEVREKGVLTVLEERFPRVKEIRERGVLGRGAETEYKLREETAEEKETTAPKKGYKLRR